MNAIDDFNCLQEVVEQFPCQK
jgi:ankyrin repeat protein